MASLWERLRRSAWAQLVALLLVTGLLSLVLGLVDAGWVPTTQTGLALLFVGLAVGLVLPQMPREERLRVVALLAPAIGAVLLGVLFLPGLRLVLLGGAVGWVVAGALLFRQRAPDGVVQAIRFMRKAEYEAAIDAIDTVIRVDKANTEHLRLRAMIFRLWHKLDRAKRDYQHMVELAPNNPEGYNGLSEVYLQLGQLADARQAAERAQALAPGDWVATYNVALVADRQHDAAGALVALDAVLAARPQPEARTLLIVHLLRLRARARLGHTDHADDLAGLQRARPALAMWDKLLADPQAAALSALLADDIALARALISGAATPSDVIA